MAAFLPTTGFLGTGATFAADVNLVTQVAMGAALTGGAVLARRKRYVAHGICQSSVLALNLVMIGTIMWPSFREQVEPAIPRHLHRWYFAAALTHAGLGIAAQVLGLYIAAVAGTKLVPERLRFKNWKIWMRCELFLWLLALLTGMATYSAWYVRPFGER
jgi:uncharacterized membrane protein YozB (DUF420 family)